MSRILKSLLIIIAMVHCQPNESSDPTVAVDWYNQEMNDSIKKARATFNQFIEALSDTSSKFSRFCTKQSFDVFEGNEHIWLSKVRFVNNQLVGVIDNVPESNNNIEIGDTIVIDKNRMTDWIYMVDSTLVGGLPQNF